MRRQDFVAWLKAHPKPYSYSVITGYPTECGWVEKNLGVDLDQEYDRDRLVSVLEQLKYSEDHPLRERIAGNPYTNLATYRRAATSYRNFRNEQLHAGKALPDRSQTAARPVAPEPAVSTIPGEPPAQPTMAEPIAAGLDGLVHGCKVSELLALHAATLDQLRVRGIVRSANAPGGDYAELLFTRAFGWTRNENSAIGCDATDWSGRRYQIKSRRLSELNGSRQLSALRRLPEQPFDYLAAVLFEKDYKVAKAAMIPHEVVASRARFQQHTNSWTFFLDDNVWALPGVRDVTQELQRVARELDRE
jgi:hypothetical protein